MSSCIKKIEVWLPLDVVWQPYKEKDNLNQIQASVMQLAKTLFLLKAGDNLHHQSLITHPPLDNEMYRWLGHTVITAVRPVMED